MKLVDCFVELIAYVGFFLNNTPTGQTSLEQVKTDINHLITKSQDSFHGNGLPAEDFDLARFAVFTWIDEAILSSNWQEKSKWQSEQLQRTHYQTTDGGELFFDKLNQLQPQQTQVREVYYLCLSLGFTGRYCNPGDEILLEQLKSSNLKLVGGSIDLRSLEQETLFPDAYLDDGAIHHTDGKKQHFSPGLILGATVPVLLYGVLFFIYRFVLDNVGENFISLVQ